MVRPASKVPSAVIIDAVRTPVGRAGGSLKGFHPIDLAAVVLRAVTERHDVDPALVDDVIMGCATQVGEQAVNVARNAVLAAGWPASVPATTVDRQCGSGQQAVHFAAQGVMAGAYDLVVAGGVEAMSRIPVGASTEIGPGLPYSRALIERYADEGGLQPQGMAAELIAEQWSISREACDEYSLESHRRSQRAWDEKRFTTEVVPVDLINPINPINPISRANPTGIEPADGGTSQAKRRRNTNPGFPDEAIRTGATLDDLARLKPTFKVGGRITAGNSSHAADGAAAMLLSSERTAQRLGLKPRARVHAFALAGVDPITMLSGPIAATSRVLARAGLDLDDIDRFEVSEAFAVVVLAWQQEHRVDMEKVNVNGGSIALGNPLGCSGLRMFATLLHELERTGGRFGLLTMCEGGGMANATIIERL